MKTALNYQMRNVFLRFSSAIAEVTKKQQQRNHYVTMNRAGSVLKLICLKMTVLRCRGQASACFWKEKRKNVSRRSLLLYFQCHTVVVPRRGGRGY